MLLAIHHGDMAMVVTLLDEGFDLNCNLGGAHGGATALDVADLWNQPEIAALLRRHGGRRAIPNAPLTDDHHNYDVVTLFHLGWRHATAEQREQMRMEIRRMLDWCLKETLEADGSFKLMDESTLGGAFYFSVAFLHEIGFFSKANRFWTDEEFPQAAAIRDRIKAKLKSLGLDDPEAQWALMMLEANR